MEYDFINLLFIEFVLVVVEKIEDKFVFVSCLILFIYQIVYFFVEVGVVRKYIEILLNFVLENKEVLRIMV